MWDIYTIWNGRQGNNGIPERVARKRLEDIARDHKTNVVERDGRIYVYSQFKPHELLAMAGPWW